VWKAYYWNKTNCNPHKDSSKVHVYQILNWKHMSSQLCSLIECGLINKIYRRCRYDIYIYMWTDHLVKRKKGMCNCGDKNVERQLHQQQHQHNHHNFKYLYFIFANHHIEVVLRFNVRHIGRWNCPKVKHRSKYH
jgi:hypothetical protein